ncbi:MAG: hypothetical protein JRI73_12185 [Deltaproteobacteria bacterium]|nr:hypothetical protein [Deltaproteobacteria bacterium]
MKDIQNVLVVGAGVMGHGLAQTFALNNLDVFLIDKDRELLDRAEVWIRENLEFMVELNLLQPQGVEDALRRISTTTDLDDSAGKADYVLEAVSENLDLKKEIFKQLGAAAGPDIILATNTSSYDINELAAVWRSSRPTSLTGRPLIQPSPSWNVSASSPQCASPHPVLWQTGFSSPWRPRPLLLSKRVWPPLRRLTGS